MGFGFFYLYHLIFSSCKVSYTYALAYIHEYIFEIFGLWDLVSLLQKNIGSSAAVLESSGFILTHENKRLYITFRMYGVPWKGVDDMIFTI